MSSNVMKATLAAAVAGLMGTGAAHADGWFFGSSWPPVWQTAVRVDAVSEPGVADGCPIETADGMSILFASARGGEPNDIWAVDRASIDAPWQAPRRLEAPINLPGVADFCPTPIRGRSLMFVSTRPATPDTSVCGDGDMYIARQSPAGGWSEPVNLGCAPLGPNTAGAERSPSLVETLYGTFLFYSTNGTTGTQDIHVSTMRADGTFGPGRVIEGLSTQYEDLMPNVREREFGGYEMVFSSNKPTPASGGQPVPQDVYTSFAWFLPGPWSTPINLGPAVNTVTGTEQRATLSHDGKRLYFGRDGDIFVSQRKR